MTDKESYVNVEMMSLLLSS